MLHNRNDWFQFVTCLEPIHRAESLATISLIKNHQLQRITSSNGYILFGRKNQIYNNYNNNNNKLLFIIIIIIIFIIIIIIIKEIE